ncbi:hypothetical protein [Acidobacterium sp. S8]|uniref:hypothetical protein n=1 Tax=Acidobacterium sp. S8 TaxID=1641854 RepID=UPI00131BBEB2|nr:hypothetical protein [Acidobacterium sp. S8]
MYPKSIASLCLLTGILGAAAQAQQNDIPAGVPLRVRIDKRYLLKTGTKIEGHLIAPVYLIDHEVLPINTLVTGSILATHPVDRGTRTDAILNGDFTPLATPELRFDQITLPDGRVAAISTQVKERDGTVVRMKSSGKKRSLTQQAGDQFRQRKQDALDQITKPGKSDRTLRLLYSQLPYHPQRIWPGTQFDAVLTEPLSLQQKNQPAPLPIEPYTGGPLTGIIEARLTEDLNSATAKQGEVVHAVLTRPLLDSAKKEVVLPEGTHVEGVVLQAKAAGWFARNGKLRFTFRRIDTPQSQTAQAAPATQQPEPVERSADHAIHGRMISSEANRGQNVAIDSEGGAQATGGPDKYIAPLVLGLFAASASLGDDDNVVKNGVVGNGFGLMARIATMATANRNVAMGFSYYALSKSVYKRWIAKGKQLTFPQNTRIQIELSER